jgi:HEAT repeat protein
VTPQRRQEPAAASSGAVVAPWTPQRGTMLLIEGDDDVAPLLLRSLADVHGRVRMTAAQTLGRVGAEGYDDEIGALLSDEHRRVRAAAALALGRVGHEFPLGPLAAACSDVDPVVRSAAERAYAMVEERPCAPPRTGAGRTAERGDGRRSRSLPRGSSPRSAACTPLRRRSRAARRW